VTGGTERAERHEGSAGVTASAADVVVRRGHNDAGDYDRGVRHLPIILLVLSFPAGALAYVVATAVLQSTSLPQGLETLIVLFVPLLIAGLVMLPFLIPWFDRKAKADLAAYRANQETAGTDDNDDGDDPRTEP
jgi:hypothetical protein